MSHPLDVSAKKGLALARIGCFLTVWPRRRDKQPRRGRLDVSSASKLADRPAPWDRDVVAREIGPGESETPGPKTGRRVCEWVGA